jgi:autotransporter-associated beta strand protein
MHFGFRPHAVFSNHSPRSRAILSEIINADANCSPPGSKHRWVVIPHDVFIARSSMRKTFARHTRFSQVRRDRHREARLTPTLELLELKLLPSTYTWTGGGANSDWSTGANWQGGIAPTSGSVLVFGPGESQLTNVNDIVGLSLAEIQIVGGYSISGDMVSLNGSGGVGIDSQSGSNTLTTPITLGANLSFTEDAGQLTLGGVISGSGLSDCGVSTGIVTDSGAAATFTVNAAAANTFSGVITNGAHGLALTKTGAGTLILSGTNTYSGTTTISAGAVQLGSGGTTGTLGSGKVVDNAALYFNRSDNGLTITSVISGTGSVSQIASGTTTLAAANTYSGTTTISAGTLQIGRAGTTGSLGAGAITDNAAVSFNRSNNVTVGNVITGNGRLAQAGSGTLILTAGNSYSGITTISAGKLQVGNAGATGSLGTGAVTDNAALSFNLTTTITVANIISGSGSVTQAGSGTTVLSGANTYGGATTISAGTLSASGGSAIPDTSSVTLANVAGATLNLASSETIGSLAGGGATGGNVTLSANTLTTGANNTSTTYSGIISGTGNLSKAGTGTFTVSRANSYTGATTVSAGTLKDGVANALPAGTPLTVNGTGTFDLGGLAQTVGGLADGGVSTGTVTDSGAAATLTVNAAVACTFSGLITNGAHALALTINGVGTLVLSGTNTYSGITTISAGTLQIGNAGITGSLGMGNLVDNASLDFDRTDNGLIVTTAISGTGSVLQIGSGTTTLNAVNSYSGGTTISAGRLSVSADNNLGAAPASATPGSVTLNGGTLAATGTFMLNANRGISLGASGGTIDVASGATLTYIGVAAGTGGLTKIESGTLVLGGSNTYSGGSTLSGGTLSIAADSNLGAAPSAATPGALTINGGTLATTGTFTLNANRGISLGTSGATIDAASGTILSYNGIAAGTGGLTKVDGGALLLGGGNTYSGVTTINAGTLKDGVANALSAGTTLTVGGTGTFDLGGFAQTVGGLADGGVSTGIVTDSGAAATFTVTAAASSTFSGAVTNGSNALALTKTGAGALTLSGLNTYSGATTINAGRLIDGVANSLPTTTKLTVDGTGTFDLGGFAQTVAGLADGGASTGTVTDSAAANTLTVNNNAANSFSGKISGSLALTKTAAGTLTLSNANTFTGATTVSGGTLLINGSQSGSAVTVNSVATLGGTGGTVGAVLVLSGIVSPGTTSGGTGILNSGNLNFSSTATYSAELNGTTVGTGYDQLNATGTVNLGTATALNVTLGTGFTPVVGSTFTIIRSTSPISGTFASLPEGTIYGAGEDVFQVSYKNDDVTLTCFGATTTTLSPSFNPSTYGQSVTFTATVSNSTGGGVPTGGVAFYDGSNYLGAGTTLTGSGTIATSTFSIATLAAGTHSISAVYTATGEYQGGTSTNLTETVNQAPLTITADNQTAVYGAGLPALTVRYSGFVNGDSAADLATAPNISTTATAQSNTGTYPISASGANDLDYNMSYVAGTLTVTPATLIVTANNQTRPQGQANPLLTYTLTGFVNGDTSSVVSGAPNLSTTATINSPNGQYPITVAVGSFTAANYRVTTVNSILTIANTPATSVTLTASPGASSTYGQALTFTANVSSTVSGNPMPTGTVQFLVDGNSIGGAVTLLNGSATSQSVSTLRAGGHNIAAIYSGDGNYATNTGSLVSTVNPAPLTITANNQTKIYSAALPTLTVSYSGFVNGDTASSLNTQPTLSTTATAHSQTGGYAITVSAAVDANYTISYVRGTLTVTAAPLTINANNQSKIYGSALSVLTASYVGFVNSDTSASLTTQPTLTTTATAASHVSGSPYSITASGAVDPDYSISYVSGTLTVTSAPLTITANDQGKVYGAALSTLTASYSGFVNGDTTASLTNKPTLTTTATAASHVAASPYSITAGGAIDSDYTISYIAGTLTVTPAPMTITANNQTKVYGAALPALTASYSGFVNGDTAASLTAQPTLGTTATASSDVSGGPYSITASGGVDSDYAISYVAGSLTVTPAPLTITANDQTKVYGAALPTLTLSYAGFVNGDTSARLTTQPTVTTTATPSSHVSGSPYTITASGAAESDYSISYVAGALTVTPRPLTINADNQTMAYGAALPALTASYSGFINGDTSASLTPQPTLSTTATSGSHVSGIPYIISASGAVDSDYSISYVAGFLTITPVPLTITANNQTMVYGAPLPTLTASYVGFVNGDLVASLASAPTLTTTATATSDVADGPYTITASGAVDSDYSVSYVAGSLTVTPAPLTITANNQTMVYSGPLPTLTASYAGLVNGDTSTNLTNQPTLTTTATAASHVAGNPYRITASGAVDSDYTIIYIAGTFSVTPAPLTITANNQTKVYGAALPTMTVSYSGFVNGDTSTSLTTQPTLTTTATASSHVSGSPYTITASGAVDSDYSISYLSSTLTVTPAPLTITANNQTKVYGAALPTLTASYSGFVNGDISASLTAQPTLTTTATASSHVSGSPYTITASGAVDSDYSISYVSSTLTVSPAPLTITANNQTKVYGAALTALTASYSGFVNGDTPASLTMQPTLSTIATATSRVAGGPYSITPSGAVDSDYTISYVSGALTVTPAALIITADNQTMVYGASLPTLSARYFGFVNGDGSASLTTQPTLSTTATAASHVAGSPYSITASGAVDPDYSINYVSGTLTVTPAPLTITADNQTKVYGAALPALTASYSGFVNGDTSASLTMQPTLSTTATAASRVARGPYSITPSGAVDSDYTISYVSGALTETPAALIITADNQSKVYGTALPTLTAWYSGFVNGDTAASLTTQPTLSTTATAASHVSGNPYRITASGALDSDYSISYVPGTLIVTPAPLTITAVDKTAAFGAVLAALTASYRGFVNGDTPASLSRPPVLSVVATAGSLPGSYAVTVSGAASPDYAIRFQQGCLTVLEPSAPVGRDRLAFLTTLYREMLGRTPDPAGLLYWMGQLADKLKPAAASFLFWGSPEHNILKHQHRAPPIPFRKAHADALNAWRRASARKYLVPAGPLALFGRSIALRHLCERPPAR